MSGGEKRARRVWRSTQTNVLVAAILATACAGSQAATFKVLADNPNGIYESPMAFGPDGNLYGFAKGLDAGTFGRVFRLVRPAPTENQNKWQYETLFEFAGGTQGSHPGGRPYFDPDGSLYGTTREGGAYYQFCCNQGGTAFKLTPPKQVGEAWKHRIIASFGKGASPDLDGLAPEGGVVGNLDDELFGTTSAGVVGKTGTTWGSVFKLTPTDGTRNKWQRTLVYDFGKFFYRNNDSAAEPRASLVRGVDGTIYGTTRDGGKYDGVYNGLGTIFAIGPDERYDALASLAGDGSQGTDIVAGVTIAKGGRYGVARRLGSPTCNGGQGCGTVFQVTKNKVAVIHTFTGAPDDGNGPWGELVPGKSGVLYGTTDAGGANNKGTVFMLTPPPSGTGPWMFTLLHSFSGADGEAPRAGLVADGGWFYGSTQFGGQHGNGTVFRFRP